MTAGGVDFLNEWVSGKLPPMPTGDAALLKTLAQKLRDDASTAGFTLPDLELEESQVEQFFDAVLSPAFLTNRFVSASKTLSLVKLGFIPSNLQEANTWSTMNLGWK